MRIEEIAKLAETQPVPWDDVREQRAFGRIVEAQGRASTGWNKRYIYAAAAAALLVACGGIGFAVLGTDTQDVPVERVAIADVQPGVSTLDLSDAGHALLMPGAKVAVELQTKTDLQMKQTEGEVKYELQGAPGRVMSVVASGVVVSVVGTGFSVELSGEMVRVSVEHGVVLVNDGKREVTLTAGEEIAVSSVPGADSKVDLAEALIPEQEEVQDVEPLVEIEDSVPAEVQRDTPTLKQLLQQSDRARREGDLARAATLLNRLVKSYPTDARAVSAMFTLGNVERSRGRFVQAARAYRHCWKSSPSGALAEDARAQEATSLSMAGRSDKARQAAQSYLSWYPAGTHANRMRRLVE